jgi:predicted nucleotidyltransferase/DNA-binding XRE family transcriptional regulator
VNGAELRDLRCRYGLTQAQVARAAEMHQPDVSALESGRLTSADGQARAAAAIRKLARPGAGLTPEVRQRIRQAFEDRGAWDIRVFGSVARAEDAPGSDLDLMACFPAGFDLFDLLELEDQIEAITALPIDIVSDHTATASSLLRAKAEAIPL